MAYPNQKRSISAILILLPFIVLFATGFYNSAKSVEKPYQVFRKKFYNQNPLNRYQSVVSNKKKIKGQVFLQKDKKVYMDKTCLVFKGISRGMVTLDLYLLELDPDSAYPLSFSKESLQKGIWVDNVQYQLVSAKKNTLRLKIQDTY